MEFMETPHLSYITDSLSDNTLKRAKDYIDINR